MEKICMQETAPAEKRALKRERREQDRKEEKENKSRKKKRQNQQNQVQIFIERVMGDQRPRTFSKEKDPKSRSSPWCVCGGLEDKRCKLQKRKCKCGSLGCPKIQQKK
jgi:hypothetical protein